MTLIDKDEVLALIERRVGKDHPALADELRHAIAAIPARGVGVRPLAWDRCGNAQGYGCKYMVYEAGTGWNAVLYPSDAAHYQIATGVPEVEAVAACDNDHRARILATLAPTDAAQAREAALREALDCCTDYGFTRADECRDAILALIGETRT